MNPPGALRASRRKPRTGSPCRTRDNNIRTCPAIFFKQLDADGDHDIEPGETDGVRIRMLGYSWGAMEAVSVANSLNYPGWGEHRPYTTIERIPVEYLLAIDPIAIFKRNTHASGNVGHVETLLQRAPSYSGGRSWMRVEPPGQPAFTDEMGSLLSRRLSGSIITAQNGHADAYRLMRDPESTGTYVPHNPKLEDWPARLINFSWINHDTIPWVVFTAEWDYAFRNWG